MFSPKMCFKYDFIVIIVSKFEHLYYIYKKKNLNHCYNNHHDVNESPCMYKHRYIRNAYNNN